MSVLKAHRSESKAEYINTANKIYVQTIGFLSRLSSRYSRLLATPVSMLASEVLDHAEKMYLHTMTCFCLVENVAMELDGRTALSDLNSIYFPAQQQEGARY